MGERIKENKTLGYQNRAALDYSVFMDIEFGVINALLECNKRKIVKSVKNILNLFSAFKCKI